ncbi:uncharacterized protein LOC115884370 [Sitophilus oryzae]|uniref:Uncharacterized protein LOC115884370 n=1 Tax=Sitophilus oryzae TaxID=7048 RepID=A0A6J2Y6U4_SITOR|nr:uncharacterized protein LOC115884370 [Sitophilus oryzae]
MDELTINKIIKSSDEKELTIYRIQSDRRNELIVNQTKGDREQELTLCQSEEDMRNELIIDETKENSKEDELIICKIQTYSRDELIVNQTKEDREQILLPCESEGDSRDELILEETKGDSREGELNIYQIQEINQPKEDNEEQELNNTKKNNNMESHNKIIKNSRAKLNQSSNSATANIREDFFSDSENLNSSRPVQADNLISKDSINGTSVISVADRITDKEGDGFKRKRLSGAQKRKRAKERKIAARTWTTGKPNQKKYNTIEGQVKISVSKRRLSESEFVTNYTNVKRAKTESTFEKQRKYESFSNFRYPSKYTEGQKYRSASESVRYGIERPEETESFHRPKSDTPSMMSKIEERNEYERLKRPLVDSRCPTNCMDGKKFRSNPVPMRYQVKEREIENFHRQRSESPPLRYMIEDRDNFQKFKTPILDSSYPRNCTDGNKHRDNPEPTRYRIEEREIESISRLRSESPSLRYMIEERDNFEKIKGPLLDTPYLKNCTDGNKHRENPEPTRYRIEEREIESISRLRSESPSLRYMIEERDNFEKIKRPLLDTPYLKNCTDGNKHRDNPEPTRYRIEERDIGSIHRQRSKSPPMRYIIEERDNSETFKRPLLAYPYPTNCTDVNKYKSNPAPMRYRIDEREIESFRRQRSVSSPMRHMIEDRDNFKRPKRPLLDSPCPISCTESNKYRSNSMPLRYGIKGPEEIESFHRQRSESPPTRYTIKEWDNSETFKKPLLASPYLKNSTDVKKYRSNPALMRYGIEGQEKIGSFHRQRSESPPMRYRIEERDKYKSYKRSLLYSRYLRSNSDANKSRSHSPPQITSSPEATNPTRLAIIEKRHPDIKLSQEQAALVQNTLVDLLYSAPSSSSSRPPQFLRTAFTAGYLWMTCANKRTEEWLRRSIDALEPLWEEGGVRIACSGELPIRYRIIGFVPGQEEALESIKSRIEIQNPGLKTGDWSVLNCKIEADGKLLVFSIDEASFITLETSQFRVFYKLGRVNFNVIHKKSDNKK